MPIGSRLKELRKRRQQTQRRLGEQIGRTQQGIHFWEKGIVRIPAESIPTLASALNVPILAFFEDDDASAA